MAANFTGPLHPLQPKKSRHSRICRWPAAKERRLSTGSVSLARELLKDAFGERSAREAKWRSEGGRKVSGTLLAVVCWLRWPYHEGRHYEDLSAVAGRLQGLVGRLERIRG